MPIQDWNILLNIVIAVLLVGYGVWVRNIFRQQLASKDSTIERLGAAIKANEAEIARLRGETAPAIADSYERLKTFAQRMAAESNDLNARLEAAEARNAQIGPVASNTLLMGRIDGFLEASILFRGRVMDFVHGLEPNKLTADEPLKLLSRILSDFTERVDEHVKSLTDAQAKLE
jgi:hypothetical protein